MNSIDKKLREYMKLPYTVMLRRDEEGDFVARVKELEGCVADGQDEMEAIGNLELVKQLWLEAALKADQTVPLPDSEESLPSGKFLTRLPRSLHKSLIEIAAQEGVSLNQLVTVALAEVAGRKAAVSSTVDQIVASTHHQRPEGGYGGAYGTPRLRLVNSDRSRVPPVERVGLFDEITLQGVISMQSDVSLPKTKKEA
jgi:antitoxin HicB